MNINNLINHEHYTYKVVWSRKDQEYVGLCTEFPSLCYLHTERSHALEEITNLVKSITNVLYRIDSSVSESTIWLERIIVINKEGKEIYHTGDYIKVNSVELEELTKENQIRLE